ncbi:hypothetical protein [Burkholderia multivorans]|uniref:hypothetical protein n=1 Tax=Burkholderia multivorans TaxID=87883 RepID=UPI0021C01620|nr:hypothetical protein [Burkholderia multivorans]
MMMEVVQAYYANERQFALLGIGIGALLAILGAVLWRTSAVASLGTGMACVLLIAGSLQATASYTYVTMVDRRAEEAAKSYLAQTDAAIRDREVARMRKVLASGYTGALMLNTIFVLVGIGLVFFAMNVPVWKGVALGLMMIGIVGHGIEAFSMQTNRNYKESLKTYLDVPAP